MSSLAHRQAYARGVSFTPDSLVVELSDGRSVSAPLEWFPKLRDASEAQRRDWSLVGRGVGIRWESLDEDISVEGLLNPEAAYLPAPQREGPRGP